MSAQPTMRNTGSLRVAVVGGGIIGLSAALELRGRGADVTVYESGTELGAGVTMRAAEVRPYIMPSFGRTSMPSSVSPRN